MSLKSILSPNFYDIYGNVIRTNLLESETIKADFLKLKDLPQAIKQHQLYYNVINGQISYGETGQTSNSSNIQCNNLVVNGNVKFTNLPIQTTGNILYLDINGNLSYNSVSNLFSNVSNLNVVNLTANNISLSSQIVSLGKNANANYNAN